MIDVAQLAKTISDAPIAQEEKLSWLKLIPYMPEDDLQKLVDVLTDQTTKMRNLRTDYLSRAQKIIDLDQAHDVAETI